MKRPMITKNYHISKHTLYPGKPPKNINITYIYIQAMHNKVG